VDHAVWIRQAGVSIIAGANGHLQTRTSCNLRAQILLSRSKELLAAIYGDFAGLPATMRIYGASRWEKEGKESKGLSDDPLSLQLEAEKSANAKDHGFKVGKYKVHQDLSNLWFPMRKRQRFLLISGAKPTVSPSRWLPAKETFERKASRYCGYARERRLSCPRKGLFISGREKKGKEKREIRGSDSADSGQRFFFCSVNIDRSVRYRYVENAKRNGT